MSGRQALLVAVFGAFFLAVMVCWPWIVFPGAFATGDTVDTLRASPNNEGWTTIDWPYVANAAGSTTAELQTRVFGELVTVYHEPSLDHPSVNTFALTARPGFGYGRGWYDYDLLSDREVGGSTTGELVVYPMFNTPSILVSSKLQFGISNMLDAGGAPATGRLIIVVGPK